MDYRRNFVIVKLLILVTYTVEAMNVFQPKYFCGSLLPDTLSKYNCIYHEIRAKGEAPDDIGVVNECCFSRCSEYELVKSYCSHSDLDSVPQELLTTPKSIGMISKLYPFSQDEPNDVMKKEVLNPSIRKQQRKKLFSEVGKKRNKNRRNRKFRRGKNRISATNNKKRNKKRDCACSCFKARGSLDNKEVIFKSPVVGLTNFSRNSIIRLTGIHNHNLF